jgi:hypothetical protein
MKSRSLLPVVIAVALASRLHAGTAEPQEVPRLIQQLGSPKFAERETASRRLDAVGVPALNPLRQAAHTDTDAEIRRRARDLVQAIKSRACGATPRKARAVMGKDGSIQIQETTTRIRQEMRCVVVNVNGGKANAMFMVQVPETKRKARTVAGKEVQAFGQAGKKIEPAALPELLKKETPVLIADDGKLVDPDFAEQMPAGTVLLVVPPPKTPEKGATPPRKVKP